MSPRFRLCYVLPRYEADADTHFAYLYDFLEHIGQELDIFLVVEEHPARRVPIRCLTHVYVQYFRFLPLKAAENFLVLFTARLKGYRTFYIHYSFLSAFNASLVTKLFGGRTFYWNCGLPWLYRRGWIRERFERLTYRIIDFLVTGTPSLARGYAEHYGLARERVRVMPNWIDLERIKNQESRIKDDGKTLRSSLGITSQQKVVLFVHRLSERKGADLLPDILRELRDQNAVLVVVGDGPEREKTESRIKDYELWDKVRFVGRVAQREVWTYYAIADALLMPSEEEGFPHVLLEAMAIGVPFVASDVGGVEEITPPGAHEFLVRARRAEVFAAKIREILFKTPAERQALGELLKEHVARYDIARVAPEFMKLVSPSAP